MRIPLKLVAEVARSCTILGVVDVGIMFVDEDVPQANKAVNDPLRAVFDSVASGADSCGGLVGKV